MKKKPANFSKITKKENSPENVLTTKRSNRLFLNHLEPARLSPTESALDSLNRELVSVCADIETRKTEISTRDNSEPSRKMYIFPVLAVLASPV